MKQIQIEVRPEDVPAVLEASAVHRGRGPSHFAVHAGDGGERRRVLVNLPNEEVGPFVAAVGASARDAYFVIPNTENIPLEAPIGDVRDRVADVSSRSTLELILDVLQSLGSWKGMLLYAVVSGVVATYGILFNLWFLLTAAMLIAPVGAPTMVMVVAGAVGDLPSFRRGALRFGVAVSILAVTGALFGLAYGISAPTRLMETLTGLSLWSVVLGVTGGAAGAQALVQAERDSMVTATATGFLVAVSLTPPSAVLGLSAALGSWPDVLLMAFLIVLTLAGILLGGWAALRYQGVRPGRASAGRGSRGGVRVVVALGLAALVGLVATQSLAGPSFRKADLARKGAEVARRVVADAPAYRALEVEARFVSPAGPPSDQPTLLITVLAEHRGAGPAESDAAARGRLERAVRDAVAAELERVRPVVNVTVVH